MSDRAIAILVAVAFVAVVAGGSWLLAWLEAKDWEGHP